MYPYLFQRKLARLAWIAVLIVLAMPDVLLAAPTFPRGPGFYFDPFKLVGLTVSLLAWIKVCAWVDLDCHRYKIDPIFWNSLLLGGGVLGFLLIWNLSIFWFTVILAWGFVAVPAYWYITVRNRRADPEDQLFNQAFFERLYQKYSGKSTETRGDRPSGGRENDQPRPSAS